MRIGILGAGRMAGALAPAWVAAGHELLIGGRTGSEAASLADRVGADAGSLEQVARFGEVVLLAVLYDGVDATLAAAGADSGTLRGRVLIDITNPVNTTTFLLRTPPGTSVAEQIAARSGARVVKALHQVHGAVYLERARYGGAPLVVPIAGDTAAKEIVGPLIRDLGAEPLDAGELVQARNLEAMAAVVIRLLFTGAPALSAFQWQVGTGRGQ